jgi:large subunit ribosomal protein L6
LSRIGRKPIEIPQGVEVKVEGRKVIVKGPKGVLEKELPPAVTVRLEEGSVIVERESDERKVKAFHGLARSLIANMVKGVTEGFEKRLQIVGVGYRAFKKGNDLEIHVGYSQPKVVKKPEGIEFEVPDNNTIVVKGIDKEKVGQVAANIRFIRPPEPYKGKGIRYVDEYVRRKAGKAGRM